MQASIQQNWCPQKGKNLDTETDIHREGHHVKCGGEVSQKRDYGKLGPGTESFLAPAEGTGP